ncbi:MAG TPA: hypothetical protein VHX60_12920 [Acidobacteriaceae bacterium]|jgi:hypothetical protein|nr:hypothetical protein [Acidobacteriaceae bacterium]
MKIVRQTNSKIVVRDSSLWIASVCGVAFLVVFFATLATRNYRGTIASGLLLVFAIAWLRRSNFVFDGPAQMVRWKRLRYLRLASGAIPFSEVLAINVESSSSDKANVLTYRLSIATTGGNVPMSDVYSSGHGAVAALQDRLQSFVIPSRAPAASPLPDAPPDQSGDVDAQHTSQLNGSIRSLLQQGRKIDAILLVQRTDHLDLTEATFRVNQIDHQMKSERMGP